MVLCNNIVIIYTVLLQEKFVCMRVNELVEIFKMNDYIFKNKIKSLNDQKSLKVFKSLLHGYGLAPFVRQIVLNEVFCCAIVVTEEQCLHQIYLDEQFGSMETITTKKAEEDKKKYD